MMKKMLALAMMLCLFALPALADLKQDGSGYYLIADADDLHAFADMVNGGNTDINGKLTANITLSSGMWTPIGNENKKFAGSFDGQGYSVSKVSVDSDTLYAGLFGYAGSGATISNLTVNADIFVRNTEEGADAFVGGIVGYNDSGATVSDCTVKGSVKGEAKNYNTEVIIGSIAGVNSGTITDCTNYAKLIAYARFDPSSVGLNVYTGGIVGRNSGGSIKKCSNHGDADALDEINNKNTRVYAGGIVASLKGGSVSDCYNTADVYSKSLNSHTEDIVYAGGIAGYVQPNRTVTNCYSTGITSGSTAGAKTLFGAIAGGGSSQVTNCYYTQNRSGTGDSKGSTILVTSNQMKSGEVAYSLGSASPESGWGQDLDNGKTVQTTPNFTGAKVYEFTNCAGTIVYSNTQGDEGDHKWTYTADGATITQRCDYGCGQRGSVILKAAENLVYDGTKKENVFTTEGAFVGTAIPAINCDDEIINAGMYTATLTVEGVTATVEAEINKAAPTAELFTFAPPSNLAYNATPKAAAVTPNSGVKGMGEITLIYCDEQGNPINESPLNAGTYTVKINVAEGDNYTAAVGIAPEAWTFTISPIDPTFALPENLTATYGDTLSAVAIPAAENGMWMWEDGDALVGVVGQQTHKATFTPNDSRNYNTITGVELSVTVHKAAPAVTAPTANPLTYTGSAHTLITAGSTADGEMRYSLDGENWSDALPTATNAGEYTVYYKVIGDSNHLDSEAASVTVTIARSATSMTAKLLDNKSEYTYGETVKIAVTPAATGAAPLSLRRFTAPAKGQVALYNGSEQITEPKAAGHGEPVTFTLDTVADGLTPGSHTLTARYTASGNMDAQETDITFSVAFAEDAPANDADVSGDRNEAGWHRADPMLTAPEGSKISLGCGPEAEWSDSLTLPTEDGEHPYTYYVKDESGLISEKAVTVMVDKSAPVVGEIDIQVGTNGAEITAPATDEHSGILDCRITVNSGKGELEISGNGDSSYTITGMIPGETYDFTLTVMDRVGHTTAVSFTVTAAQLPQTGDEGQLGLWLMLMGMACAGMLTLRRKAHN